MNLTGKIVKLDQDTLKHPYYIIGFRRQWVYGYCEKYYEDDGQVFFEDSLFSVGKGREATKDEIIEFYEEVIKYHNIRRIDNCFVCEMSAESGGRKDHIFTETNIYSLLIKYEKDKEARTSESRAGRISVDNGQLSAYVFLLKVIRDIIEKNLHELIPISD